MSFLERGREKGEKGMRGKGTDGGARILACARLACHPYGPLAMWREFLNNSYALRASRCLVAPSTPGGLVPNSISV